MKPAAMPSAASNRATRTATTFRLEPSTQESLVLIGKVLKVPVNRLVNEALATYAHNRMAEVATDLEQTLALLKARRSSDPNFETALADVANSEAQHGLLDPAEAKIINTPGAVQARVQALLNR